MSLGSALPSYQENAGGDPQCHTAAHCRGESRARNTTEEYVRFFTHRGTLTPTAQRGQCIPTASALVQQTHIAVFTTYALVKSSLLLLLLLILVHPCPLLPSPPPPPPPPPVLCRPVARMDKTLCSPHPGTNKTNSSSSSDRGNTRKPARTGSQSPGCSSLGGPAGAGGSRGALLGNSMNLQQQARKRQLEGVLSKYTNLIQGWQNR